MSSVEHKWKWNPDVLDFSVPTDILCIPTRLKTASFNRCSICLGEYQEKEVLRIMPKCGHNFHLSCIDVWLRKHSTCPVCRFSIQDSFEAKHMRQAAISMVQSIDSPDTPSEHSRQWLLPGSYQHQVGTHSNQRHLDPVPGNSEITPGEPQTSHSWTKETGAFKTLIYTFILLSSAWMCALSQLLHFEALNFMWNRFVQL